MKFILTLCGFIALLSHAVAADKPNILLILADDLGYGDVGCYNDQAKVATPNLDRLAQAGMRFTDAHSPAAVCTPARYSLMTGQMAFRAPRGWMIFTGVGGPSLIAPGRLTLPAMLREKGYRTAAVGKWHIGMTFFDKNGQPIRTNGLAGVRLVDFSRRIDGGPVDHGFDSFFGTACCPGTDWLYAFIEGDRVPVPPASMINRKVLPHHPYSEDCRDGLIATNYSLEDLDLVFLERSKKILEEQVRTKPGQPFFLYHATAAVHLPSFAAKRFQGATKAGPHGDYICEFDWIVGELMKTLKRVGVADNTIVIVSSDNGPEVESVAHMRADYGHDGARPWRGVKRDDWEGGHRVPFIVHWPGKVKADSTSGQTASLTDVMATIAAVVDAKIPDNAAEDSFNLLPAWLGKDTAPIRPYLLEQAFRGEKTLSIRKGQWKYLNHSGSGGNDYLTRDELKPYYIPDNAPGAPGQLYNLVTDPGETNNLYFKYPEIVKELKTLLDDSKRTGRSAPLANVTPP